MRRHNPAHVRNGLAENHFSDQPRTRKSVSRGHHDRDGKPSRRTIAGLVALGAVFLATAGCAAGQSAPTAETGPLLTEQETWPIADAGKVDTISDLWVSANQQWAYWEHDEQLAVVDLTSRAVVRSYPAEEAVISPDQTRMYAQDGNRIRVIDADAAEQIDEFPVNLKDALLAPVMSPDGRLLLFSLSGDTEEVGLVDVASKALTTVPLPRNACADTLGAYLSGDGSTVFASGTYSEDRGCPRGGGISRVSLGDPAAVEAQIPVPIDDPGDDVLTLGDPGLSAWVGEDLFVITDPETGFTCSVCARGVEGAWPTKITAVDTNTNSVKYSVPIEPAIRNFVVAPQTRRLYTMGVDISAVSMDAQRVEGSVELPSDDIKAIAVSQSETALYALTEGRGDRYSITVLGP